MARKAKKTRGSKIKKAKDDNIKKIQDNNDTETKDDDEEKKTEDVNDRKVIGKRTLITKYQLEMVKENLGASIFQIIKAMVPVDQQIGREKLWSDFAYETAAGGLNHFYTTQDMKEDKAEQSNMKQRWIQPEKTSASTALTTMMEEKVPIPNQASASTSSTIRTPSDPSCATELVASGLKVTDNWPLWAPPRTDFDALTKWAEEPDIPKEEFEARYTMFKQGFDASKEWSPYSLFPSRKEYEAYKRDPEPVLSRLVASYKVTEFDESLFSAQSPEVRADSPTSDDEKERKEGTLLQEMNPANVPDSVPTIEDEKPARTTVPRATGATDRFGFPAYEVSTLSIPKICWTCSKEFHTAFEFLRHRERSCYH